MQNGSIIANALYQNGQILAYSLSRNFKNYLYLSYLAVDKNFRDQGIGSDYVKALANAYPSKTILVDIEQVEDLGNKTDIKTRRANFYLKNGFQFTPITSKIWGVKYNIMAFGKQSESLLQDYLNMQQQIQGADFETKVDVFVHGKCVKSSKTFEL